MEGSRGTSVPGEEHSGRGTGTHILEDFELQGRGVQVVEPWRWWGRSQTEGPQILSKGVSPPIPTPTQFRPALQQRPQPAPPPRPSVGPAHPRPFPPVARLHRFAPCLSPRRGQVLPAAARSSPQSCRIFRSWSVYATLPFWSPHRPSGGFWVASGAALHCAAARPAPFSGPPGLGRAGAVSKPHAPPLSPRHRGTSSLGLSHFLCLRCHRPPPPTLLHGLLPRRVPRSMIR